MPDGKVSRGFQPEKMVEQAIRDVASPMGEEDDSQPRWLESELEDPTGKTSWVRNLDRAAFYDSPTLSIYKMMRKRK
eukprot:2234156-Amphidinium_carterae.2